MLADRQHGDQQVGRHAARNGHGGMMRDVDGAVLEIVALARRLVTLALDQEAFIAETQGSKEIIQFERLLGTLIERSG